MPESEKLVVEADAAAFRRQRRRAHEEGFWARWEVPLAVFAVLFVFYLGPASVVQVPSGTRAVLAGRSLSGTGPRVLGEGLHLKAPWAKVAVYDLRSQHLDVQGRVQAGGLPLEVDLTVQFRLRESALIELHERVGPVHDTARLRDEVFTALEVVLDKADAAGVREFVLRPLLLQEALGPQIEREADRLIEVDDVVIHKLRSDIPVVGSRQAAVNVQGVSEEVIRKIKEAMHSVEGRPIVIVVGGGKP